MSPESVYLITGATDGIGRALACALAATDATVVLHGRNSNKLAETLAQVQAASGSEQLHTVQADFAVLAQVEDLAAEVAERFSGLNVLINNAGHLTDHRQVSADGFELTFAVNYLAPFLLTNRLLDTLYKNAPARIVNVASTAFGGGTVDFNNLQLERDFSGWQAYANSKLANVLFSYTLADQLEDSGVISNALCPGLIDTNFFHTNTVFANGAYERMQPGMRSPEEGALVPLYLAADPEAAGSNGQFFVRIGRDGRRPVSLDVDAQLAARLWEETAALLEAAGYTT